MWVITQYLGQPLWCCTCDRNSPKIYCFCPSHRQQLLCSNNGNESYLPHFLIVFLVCVCIDHWRGINHSYKAGAKSHKRLQCPNWKSSALIFGEKTSNAMWIITQNLGQPFKSCTCERHSPNIYMAFVAHIVNSFPVATMRLNRICFIFLLFSLSVSALTTDEVSTIRTKLERKVVRGSNVPTALRLSFHDCVGGFSKVFDLFVDYWLW